MGDRCPSVTSHCPKVTSNGRCQRRRMSATDPLLPFEQSEVQRQVSDWSSRPTKSLNDNLSALADVERWCLEGLLCFALPTFDHVPPKTWSDQSERLLSENGNFRYRPKGDAHSQILPVAGFVGSRHWPTSIAREDSDQEAIAFALCALAIRATASHSSSTVSGL